LEITKLWKKPLPGASGFKTSLRIFNVSATCIVEDQELLQQFLSKNQAKKLKSDVKRAFKFLYKLDPKDTPPSKKSLIKWANIFDGWQHKLTAHHIIHQNMGDWLHLGRALHYLLDGLYHVFCKFLSKNKKYRRCFWCSTVLSDSWTKVLSQIVIKHTLASYVHLRIASADIHITEQAFDDMLELVKLSLTSVET